MLSPPLSHRPRIRRARFHLWPAVLVTLGIGTGFAGLKFVLINEIALSLDITHPPHMPFRWMQEIVSRCIAHGTLAEAISQGLAATLTIGVLIGYAINAPLSGAWRCKWLFFAACAGVAVGTLATLWCDAWLIAWLVGISYGAACAARGKVVPLLARATRRSNTLVSGYINAALVIGLLIGTVFGTMLGDQVVMQTAHQETVVRHLALFAVLAVATGLCLLVQVPEPRPIAFAQGMHDLARGTSTMLSEHWALLVGGGLSWGIASAASLAVYIDAIDPTRLGLRPTVASVLAVFAALGAIMGNLLSPYFNRRRHVMLSLAGLGLCIALYPHLVHTWWSAAVMMLCVGGLFAAPVNVLDARLLALSARQNMAGRGATVMSLVHNVFIFMVGSGLAVSLFLGVMTATVQFYVLGAVALLTMVVVSRARLTDEATMLNMTSEPVTSRIVAASTGIAQ